jgi:hypothetical protein
MGQVIGVVGFTILKKSAKRMLRDLSRPEE